MINYNHKTNFNQTAKIAKTTPKIELYWEAEAIRDKAFSLERQIRSMRQRGAKPVKLLSRYKTVIEQLGRYETALAYC